MLQPWSTTKTLRQQKRSAANGRDFVHDIIQISSMKQLFDFQKRLHKVPPMSPKNKGDDLVNRFILRHIASINN